MPAGGEGGVPPCCTLALALAFVRVVLSLCWLRAEGRGDAACMARGARRVDTVIAEERRIAALQFCRGQGRSSCSSSERTTASRADGASGGLGEGLTNSCC